MSEIIETAGSAKDVVTIEWVRDIVNPVAYGRSCIICQACFDVASPNDIRQICPECTRRLKNLIYPGGYQQ